MAGKARPCLRKKTLGNVKISRLSETDKKCIFEVFQRYENLLKQKESMINALKSSCADLCKYCVNIRCIDEKSKIRTCPLFYECLKKDYDKFEWRDDNDSVSQ